MKIKTKDIPLGLGNCRSEAYLKVVIRGLTEVLRSKFIFRIVLKLLSKKKKKVAVFNAYRDVYFKRQTSILKFYIILIQLILY